MDGTLHSVALPDPGRNVLHRGSCPCGWTVGYDPASYARAIQLAHEHVADALEDRLTQRR